jgi:hypothetical protein
VHIGELHTDVRTPAPAPDRPGEPPRMPVDEQVAEARRRADWVAARTGAEGFDD